MKRYHYAAILVLCLLLTFFSVQAEASFYILNGVRYEEPNQSPITLLLDGEPLTTDVGPVIVDHRVLVPARKIFESMGATVTWIAEEEQVVIRGAVSVELFIDRKEARVDGTKKTMDVPATLIDGRTMVPVRFVSEALDCQVDWIAEERTVTIERKPVKAFNTLSGMDCNWAEEEGRLRISLSFSDKDVSFDSFTLKEPHRMVLDFKDTILGKVSKTTPTDCPIVPTVRSAQFSEDPMTVRVVVDLTEATQGVISKSADGKTLYIDFQYQDIRLYRYNEPPALVLGGAKKGDIDLSVAEDTVTVIVSGVSYPEEDTKEQNDYYSRVKVEKRKTNTRLTITLCEGIKATLSGNRILFLKEAQEIKDITLTEEAKDLLVFIDPGHGGVDVGAVGYDEDGNISLYEKKVNLQIALQVNTLLLEMGAKTQMSRTTDTAVDLAQRPVIANEAKADLFISVHNNSFTSDAASGTEVLYGSDTVSDYGISEKRVAQLILEELAPSLGRPNRGVKHQPGMAVIRLSEMPAVIVEGLFLSNPTDLAMLKDSEVVEKIAVGIARGVAKALNEMASAR